MVTFFTMLSPSVNDEEFGILLGEMLEVATNAATIFSLTAIAAAGAEQAATLSAPEEGEEPEPAAEPLGEARAALVRALYEVFPAGAKGIETAALQADSAFKLGPHSTNLLSTLTLMDADSDGSVTLDEMLGYFAAVGGALTDDEFGTVVSEMTDQANASKMEHMAGAM